MTTNPKNPTYVRGKVSVQELAIGARVDAIYASAYDELVVKRAGFLATASGDNTVIAAVTGKSILVLSFQVVAAGAVGVRWMDGAGAFLTGAATAAGRYLLAANQALTEQDPYGLFKTGAGQALIFNTSAAVNVPGRLTYVEV